ncbi:MAG TPA: hypothetical protein VMP13_02900 [Acidimicrobiia bacterium]|nr:hypothetical protein [Acidimicrobiia bacterium]
MTEQVLIWAEDLAEKLTFEMKWTQSDYGGYWEAESPEAKARIRARATAALDFLERFAGQDSQWTRSAHSVFENKGDHQSLESGARAIGDVLTEWISRVRSGQLMPRSIESLGVREVASTDLMDQVRALNADSGVNPAAPIVLAGAALEISLRSAVEELNLDGLVGKPSIGAYARVLRSAELLNKQDMKDVEQMAGLRNAAAHGLHGELSRERAGLFEQQVNLFLRRLDELLHPSQRRST